MNIPFVDLKRQHKTIAKIVEKKLIEIARKGEYILGPEVEAFEAEFSTVTGARYTVGVASGTDGLVIALRALGIGNGDEIITVSNTFIATALAITYTGAIPRFVDIDPKTYNIDTNAIEQAITPETKAIMPVFLYGQPANMDTIQTIAKKYNLKIIIDACQAHGSLYAGKPIGQLGDCLVYSFYPTKNLGGYGDGGAITTNDKKLADDIRVLRNVGRTGWYDHKVKGYNSRLDNIQAGILRIKLHHLTKWNAKRRQKVQLYNELLKTIPITLPYEDANVTGVFYLYVIRSKYRDELQKYLDSKGIHTAIHYPIPIHLQDAYKELGYKKGDFPESEKAVEEILSLPFFTDMTEKEQRGVVKEIKKFYKTHK